MVNILNMLRCGLLRIKSCFSLCVPYCSQRFSFQEDRESFHPSKLQVKAQVLSHTTQLAFCLLTSLQSPLLSMWDVRVLQECATLRTNIKAVESFLKCCLGQRSEGAFAILGPHIDCNQAYVQQTTEGPVCSTASCPNLSGPFTPVFCRSGPALRLKVVSHG